MRFLSAYEWRYVCVYIYIIGNNSKWLRSSSILKEKIRICEWICCKSDVAYLLTNYQSLFFLYFAHASFLYPVLGVSRYYLNEDKYRLLQVLYSSCFLYSVAQYGCICCTTVLCITLYNGSKDKSQLYNNITVELIFTYPVFQRSKYAVFTWENKLAYHRTSGRSKNS